MKHKGSCHCKAVEFEVESDLENIRQCNCSICIRRNAKMIIIAKENFTLLKGEDHLSLYQFNTNVAKHFFVKNVVFIPIIIQEVMKLRWELI